MNTPHITIICALSENRVIGKDNKLPWHIPEDLKRFRSITSGHVVIMGRKTYESMGRLLPNRLNILVTTNTDYHVEGAVIASSLEDAIAKAKVHEKEEIFIIGGGQIFTQALPFTDRLYLTIVHKTIEGDTFFPEYSQFSKKISSEKLNDEVEFIDLEK
jgi:dihydrofolate reductase